MRTKGLDKPAVGETLDPVEPRSRAVALPPEQRRAAIVEATLPLLLEHGAGVTTRQIAEAASVAEGTIFRVFPDKEALIAAVFESTFDPEPVREALRSVNLAQPLEDRLVDAVDILRRRVTTIWELIAAVGLSRIPEQAALGVHRRPPDLEELQDLIEPDRGQLRRDPSAIAELLRAFVFAGSHPALIGEDPLSSTEIVSVLLDGVRTPHTGGKR